VILMFLLGFWNSSFVSHDISSDTTSSGKPYNVREDCNTLVSFCSGNNRQELLPDTLNNCCKEALLIFSKINGNLVMQAGH